MKKIKSALISVFHKKGLENIIQLLKKQDVQLISTGGTLDYIRQCGADAVSVEEITDYPSILGGRVKTLHPKVFGGILYRRENETDQKQVKNYHIPSIDLVIVDLYPFEETVKSGADEQAVIEKIDIGGISLIRAAAKNYKDVLIVSCANQYQKLEQLLTEKNGETDLNDRREFAKEAFELSSSYDRHIHQYFEGNKGFSNFENETKTALRYGENPHQKGFFIGNMQEVFEQLHGKEISYNNLGDIDAALRLVKEFEEPVFAIFKHQNACGVACREELSEAYKLAFQADTVSPFGGVLACNRTLDIKTAEQINSIFFEVILSPAYDAEALELLKSKKNRIILQTKALNFSDKIYKTALNGMLMQDSDEKTVYESDLKTVTHKKPGKESISDLLFANTIVKHTKSNAIVLAKNKQLLGSGIGQTSRVDALKQAIQKAKEFGLDLQNSVMASDAFFPFADSVEIAYNHGIRYIIQPGGSIRDQESIDFCNEHDISMVFTGFRHFKH